jgi:hypothetical protein
MANSPIYSSKCTAGSLWQEYRIYDDRVEFHTWFGPWTIPFEQIESVQVAEPIVKAVLHLRADMKDWPRQIKLDTADIHEHVTLEKNSGLIRRVFFTPDDSKAFKNALEAALARFRAKARA